MSLQLCGESLASWGQRPINRHLSTLCTLDDLAHIEWAFHEKANRSPGLVKRIPSSRHLHTVGIKFDFAKLRESVAGIRPNDFRSAIGGCIVEPWFIATVRRVGTPCPPSRCKSTQL